MESISSPQLMQENCFNLAYYLQQGNVEVSEGLVEKCFQLVVENYASYDALFVAIKQGSPRGTGRRKLYALENGVSVDIYGLLLAALRVDPPVEMINMNKLKQRLSSVLPDAEKMPSTSQLSAVINKIIGKIEKAFPGLDVLAYRDQCLYILDPFFLFTLRW